MKPNVCILRTDGTNCDEETKNAFEKAGATGHLIHVNQLRTAEANLGDYHILAIPGGFSYGDDVAAGKILAVELISCLRHQLEEFVAKEKLVIGICNGFQVLVRTGLLPFGRLGELTSTLDTNDSGRFECRWVSMIVEESPCVFTQGLTDELELQAAHGEGKFIADPAVLATIEVNRLVALRYSRQGQPTQGYPNNPNGSLNAIAGVCDPTGRIFGLMPHPERFVEITQHPNWRRLPKREPQGLRIFENAVRYFK